MTRFDLTAGDRIENTATYTTAPVTPRPGALVLAFVANARNTAGAAATPTASGNGLGWDVVRTATSGGGRRRLTCFRATGEAPINGPVSFGFGG
jgi:hypothetical protein